MAQNQKILVIEDDRDILELIIEILKADGFDVKGCRDGDVFNIIDDFKPQLIVCDTWLPKMNGDEICRRLKSQPATEKIPFILISASLNLSLMALSCGADSYLEKPFNIREIAQIVKSYL